MLHVHDSCPCSVSIFMPTLHTSAAYPRFTSLLPIFYVASACPCFIPVLHVYVFALHVHAVWTCCVNMNMDRNKKMSIKWKWKHVHSACQCYMSGIDIHAPFHVSILHAMSPCYMSILHVLVSMLHVFCLSPLLIHTIYPCCMFLLHVNGACSCFMNIPQRWMLDCKNYFLFVKILLNVREIRISFFREI